MGNTQKVHTDDIAQAVAYEENCIRTIQQFAKLHEAELRYIWQWGDGAGGAALELMAQAIGANKQPVISQSKAKGKKKISHGLRMEVFERNAYRCVHCGTHLNLSVDHIHPESKGGTTTLDNLQTLCIQCNNAKGVKA